MTTIVTRAGKGSALTHNEGDANFTNLNTEKADLVVSNVHVPSPLAALEIDTGKELNTKTISADSTLTFSATPVTNTEFELDITNSDASPHVITIPSSYSRELQQNITTFVIPASGRSWFRWRRLAASYEIFGDTSYLNNFIATVAPTVNDDNTKGYGPGSRWLDATANINYECESGGTGAAVWHQTINAAATQTLTNKRITKRVSTTVTTASLTVASDSTDLQTVTALDQNATINAPSGTPTGGQPLVIRITASGGTRTLTWTTGSAGAFRAIGVTLPTSLASAKTTYVGCIYNATDSRWDAVAVATEA